MLVCTFLHLNSIYGHVCLVVAIAFILSEYLTVDVIYTFLWTCTHATVLVFFRGLFFEGPIPNAQT